MSDTARDGPESSPNEDGVRSTRPWIALAFVVAVFAILEISGASDRLELDRLRSWVELAGVWGPALFLVVFVIGVVLQVPGIVFVLMAPALFSAPVAVSLAVVGGNLGANAGFVVVRALGGRSLQARRAGPALVRRAFAQLDEHPIRSVAIIRCVVLIFPPVTAALALTGLRLRDHAVGTAIAVSPVFAAIVTLEAFALR